MTTRRRTSVSSLQHTFFSFGEGSHPKLEEFKVTAPDWAKEGDSIEIEANKKRYIVAVPAGTIKGHAFNVAVPGLNQSAGELRAGLPCPVRVCCIGCSTVWLVVVWGAVAFSYLVLIFWREVRWNATTLLVAHAILGLQIVSYVRCQVTPPGTVTKEWQHQAASGLEPSESCKRSGLLQPARGVFVSHEGKVVLGLDHYCFWCARPCLPTEWAPHPHAPRPHAPRPYAPHPHAPRPHAPRPHAPRPTPSAPRPTQGRCHCPPTALPPPSHRPPTARPPPAHRPPTARSPGSARPSASATASTFYSSSSTHAASPSLLARTRCTSCLSGCPVRHLAT